METFETVLVAVLFFVIFFLIVAGISLVQFIDSGVPMP